MQTLVVCAVTAPCPAHAETRFFMVNDRDMAGEVIRDIQAEDFDPRQAKSW